MQGQLYQVSYLGATYYAVPVYYPGSAVFQSWYLIAFIGGQLYPYTIVPANNVVILYNPYLGGAPPGGTPGTPTPGTPGGTPTGGTPASTVTVSPTAPVGPTNGQLWYNSSGSTVSGVPAGNYASWNSGTSSWTVLGTNQPSSVSGVIAVNGVDGAITLAAGSGISITPSGKTFTIAATGGGGSPSPGGGVTSLNTLSGAVALVAGSGITLTPSGQNITITASGGGGSPAPGSDPYPEYLTQAEGDALYLSSSEVKPFALSTAVDQAAGSVLISPADAAGQPAFRRLVIDDLPPVPGVTPNRNGVIWNVSGQNYLGAINTFVTLTSWSEQYDPTGIGNATTGVITIATAGVYQILVNGQLFILGSAPPFMGNAVGVYRNGSLIAQISAIAYGGGNNDIGGGVMRTFDAGQTLDFRFYTNYSPITINMDISIARVLDL